MSRAPGAIRRVALLGLGLMGSSLGLALRRRAPTWELVGHDPGDAAGIALARGAVHRLALSPAEAVAAADLAVLAAPVGAILELLPALAGEFPAGSVVTDLGSTKVSIAAAAQAALPVDVSFVGGHPLAGAEQSGPAAAREDLFAGRVWALCPGDAPAAAVAVVRQLAGRAGAGRVVELDATTHDRVAAQVSHLPQLLAVELLACLASHPDGQQAFSLAAGGFEDLTRIGASPFGVWEGILETNRAEILAALDRFRAGLDGLREHLSGGDVEGLARAFRLARSTQARLQSPQAPLSGENLLDNDFVPGINRSRG